MIEKHWAPTLAATLAVVMTVGCDGPVAVDGGSLADAGVDGSQPDASDPCAGLTLCAAAGASCSGDTLARCAPNADGCLVETTTDCASTGGSCDDSSGTAMCVADPCEGVPADERCDTAGRACDSDELVICEANAGGCLVETRTDCAAMPGGVCDESATPAAACALPADPCASIPVDERCAAEGTSCDDDSLVTCAPDAFGCLVETRDDCTARSGGACDDSGEAAGCTATDPCAGLTTCAAEGASCDGPELVRCAPDAFGCLVETRTTCTDATFGFCDADATPAPTCSTAAADPCMGMTLCSPEGRACDGDTLRVCSLNAFGCLVETPVDCAASGEACGELGGTSVCADVCTFRSTCAEASYCDGRDVVTCELDGDGCLVESTRTTCSDAACSASACVGSCPGVSPVVLDCASGTVAGDTSAGTAMISAYAPCTSLTNYPGNEQVFVFRNTGGPAEVRIVSTRGASTGDFDLFVLDGGDGSAPCGSAGTCVDSSTGTGATETVDFFADTGDLYYVVYDRFGSTLTTSEFTLEVTCTPVVCGDGVVGTGEECDDGGTDPSDGCSATCEVESGFRCTGAPSTCVALAPNATCAGATAITADTTITGEDVALGGTRPTGTGCGTAAGGNALYYSVTVPPSSVVTVQTSPSFDIVLLTQASCGAGECLTRTDSAPERAVLRNDTGASITRVVAVHAYSSTGSGTYDIEFSYASLAPNATCAGATAITADTTITGEDVALGGSRPTGTGCGTSSGDDALYYAVTVPGTTSVEVTTAPGFDIVLLTLDSCGASSCTYRTDSSPERATLVNDTAAPVTHIVAIHNFSSSGSGTYDIEFDFVPFECGNGRIEGAEECDDDNTMDGDGCTACAVDSGYSCTGQPSACTPNATNATCATATVVATDTVITGEQIAGGGAPPSGTGCGGGTGDRALYYLVTVPAMGRVMVQTTPGFDLVLVTQDACSDTACTFSTDSAPEAATLVNATGSDVTRVVAIRPYFSSTTSGTFDIAFTYVESIAAACVDTSSATALGVASDDTTSAIAALPFAFDLFGDTVTHYSASSNGFLQAWTSSTGSPSSAFTNGVLPSTSTPNGVIAPFWDDLRPNAGADVYVLVTGASGSQVFTLEWRNWRASSSGTEDLTFQAQIHEATGQIEYHYCLMSPGASGTLHTGSSATIGAENTAGTRGIQISRDASGAVATGSGFRFTP